jgi:hypothetical protein
MQLMSKSHTEQHARVEIMFNQWLQNGEQAAGYKELRSLHALPCIEKFRDPESLAVPLELVQDQSISQSTLDLRNWIQTHAAQLFEKSVRKGEDRCTYRPLSAILSRYRRNMQGTGTACFPPAPLCNRKRAALAPLCNRKRAAQDQMSSEQLNHEVSAAVLVDQAAEDGVAPLLSRTQAAPAQRVGGPML